VKELSQTDITFDVMDPKALAALVRSANRVLVNDSTAEDVWPWLLQMTGPQRRALQPKLQLTSLDRIGTEQGRSGAQVWLGAFFPAGGLDASLARSSPLIIKLRHRHPGRAPLADEYSRARRARAYIGDASAFALPVHLDKATAGYHYEVLWSPFSTATGFWTKDGLQHADLLEALRANDFNSAHPMITQAYAALEPMHTRKGAGTKIVRRTYSDEYSPYLRGILSTAETWWSTWASQWGGEGHRMTRDLSRQRLNPLWVATRILALERPLHVATIHGDLHPRNIVRSLGGRCRIIDFGWSGVEQHITKDFALLECNLRAVTLSADLGLDLLAKLNGAPRIVTPLAVTDVLSQRQRMVAELRVVASERLQCTPPSVEWWFEYELPLFLVALGLLRHIRHADNQLALRHFVLTLANAIGGWIESGVPPTSS
jgi:hypothetical protein